MSRLCRTVATAALSVMTVPFLPALPLVGSAVAAPNPAAPNPAARYTVVNGDYLAGIARKLQVTLPALLQANGLKANSVIVPGQQLTVPAGGVLPTVAPAVTPTSAAYTVLKGDYLVGIASKLQVTLPALLQANRMQANSVIVPGQQLTVPAGGVLPTAPPAGSTATTPTKASVSSVAASATKYTVANGDFLYGIATKLKVKLGDLLAVNAFTVTSVIKPGQQILVPAAAVFPTQVSNSVSGNGGAVSSSPPAGSAAAARIATVVAYAQAQIGKPYVAYAAGPDGFDCSGLTLMAYKTVGINLPHWSVAQALKGVPVDWVNGDIQAGDLVFTSHTNDVNAINHVGIAVDSRRWIQAPRTGDVVRLGPLPSDEKIVAVRRIILP